MQFHPIDAPYPADVPYLADASDVTAAAELIARYGSLAAREAAMRAVASRELGNARRFCRWRQIERLIALLSRDPAGQTRH